jgi:hypothetical protein
MASLLPWIQPDPDLYISWSNVVPLADPSVALLGPFNLVNTSAPFSSTSTRRSSCQWVPLSLWHDICSICASLSIFPPSVSAQPVIRSRWTKSKKRKRTTSSDDYHNRISPIPSAPAVHFPYRPFRTQCPPIQHQFSR